MLLKPAHTLNGSLKERVRGVHGQNLRVADPGYTKSHYPIEPSSAVWLLCWFASCSSINLRVCFFIFVLVLVDLSMNYE